MGGDQIRSGESPGWSGFNPRPRMGGDARRAGRVDRGRDVSIHAPAWGATCYPRVLGEPGYGFNPRPRMGGDAEGLRLAREPRAFQSTPPHGGRRRRGVSLEKSTVGFQSTPPHGGRPGVGVDGHRGEAVSIHAPAWGATSRRQEDRESHCGFNPRPRMGGDSHKPHQVRRTSRFNPRPRMGGDLGVFATVGRDVRVSIHAPAWGATRLSWTTGPRREFQSTPPHGGRLHQRGRQRLGQHVSIHAPAWGATMWERPVGEETKRFNPRPRMGGDESPRGRRLRNPRFQSTPPHGGRLDSGCGSTG